MGVLRPPRYHGPRLPVVPDRHNSKKQCLSPESWFCWVGAAEGDFPVICLSAKRVHRLIFCFVGLTKCCLTCDSEQNVAAIQSAQMNLPRTRPLFVPSADVSASSLSIYTASLSAENICTLSKDRAARLDQRRSKHSDST